MAVCLKAKCGVWLPTRDGMASYGDLHETKHHRLGPGDCAGSGGAHETGIRWISAGTNSHTPIDGASLYRSGVPSTTFMMKRQKGYVGSAYGMRTCSAGGSTTVVRSMEGISFFENAIKRFSLHNLATSDHLTWMLTDVIRLEGTWKERLHTLAFG